ncbi:MAG: FAD-binding oxidoreductase [Chloroflexi bacterium]|nr:FAD-binding oxidoreductase [Chloroflexota bacterium]
MQEDEVHQRLLALLGPEGVSWDEATLRRYASDALRPSRAFPGVETLVSRPQWVARPRNVPEVQGLVRLANEAQVPLIPFGGGSGLMGGALSPCGGIVVDLKGLDRVRRISPEDRTATAEAGVVLQRLEEQLNPAGLMLGHDPWTLPVATVGGAISTNSLGYRGAQYGSMGQQVLGIEAVLPTGEVVQTRAVPKSSTGVSLHQLFIGAEGCLGLVTAATLQVFPLPEHRVLQAVDFPSFEAGFGVIQEMFSRGLVPALVELGEEFETALPPGWGRQRHVAGGAQLFLAFEGIREIAQAQARLARRVWQRAGGARRDPRIARRFWERRHDAAERYLRHIQEAGVAPYLQPWQPPVVDYLHVALPASQVLEYRRRSLALAAAAGLQVRECGLWNRPELFSLVVVDAEGPTGRLGQGMDALLALAQDLGGSMEYCHGVGVRLAHLMEREHGAGLTALRRIKHALDPQGILNPGKLAL